MYYYSKKSKKKILHTMDCFHINETNIDNVGCFETLSLAYEKGYRLCKHCNILTKFYNNEKDKILDFCMRNGLYVHLRNRCIHVNTIKSKWKIIFDDSGKLVLYHQNTFATAKDYLSEVNGYHLQRDVWRNSIVDYLEYVVEHDSYRMHNPAHMPKKKAVTPPRKGTKRYRSAQRRMEKSERKMAIRNVLNLIDSLSVQAVGRSVAG